MVYLRPNKFNTVPDIHNDMKERLYEVDMFWIITFFFVLCFVSGIFVGYMLWGV